MPKGAKVDNRGVSDTLKMRVLRRDGYKCVYCGVRVAGPGQAGKNPYLRDAPAPGSI